MLLPLECIFYQVNTDGVLYRFKKAKYEQLQQVLKQWEDLTKLELETEEFSSFYQLAINDYFGVEKEEIKKKDSFLLKYLWEKV